MPTDHTETQPNPNISTEHQRDGDARRPSDTLDRGQQTDHTETQPRPNLSTEPRDGGGQSEDAEEDRDTPGGNDQEKVEDRPNVGQVSPDDYPADQRGGGTPSR